MKGNSEELFRSHHERGLCSTNYRMMSVLDESIDGDNNWLISLSDVLSLLLVFFIMYLVMTKGSGARENTGPVEDRSQAIPSVELHQPVAIVGERIRDELSSEINNLDLGDDISVLATGREVVVTVKERVTFQPGEAEILSSFEPVLDNIVGIIEKYPSLRIDVTGHTDSIPIRTLRYPSNWELSVARATSVVKYLIHNHSITPSRLSVKGNADHHPIVPNDTPENRAQNRRVEIRFKQIE